MSSSALSFESILDCVSDIVLVTDADLLEDAGPHIVYVNDAFERITGYPRADVIGLNPRFLQGPQTSREVTQTIRKALGNGKTVRECVVNYTKDERPYWTELNIVPLRDEHSVVTHFVCLQRDLTVQKRVQDELYRLATTDPLTNIANRRAFFERGAIEVDKARRYSRPLSLVMFDIDHFKRLNDTYGHESGDVVLKGVASRALGILRQVDLLGRLGGEEFAVALPETSAKRAGEVAERLRLQIAANPYHLPNGEAFTSASFGVATLGSSHDTLETLLRRADEALYRAKGGGRNRVETRLAQVQ